MDEVCRGAVPSELTAQFVFHSWSLPMLLLGGVEKHFITGNCIFPLLCAEALLCCHRKPGIGQVWNHEKDSFDFLDLKSSLGNKEQIRRNY